jgi:molybdenum cofactor guanylyltransferase
VERAVAGPVVVVRAPDQELPALPPGVRVVEDAAEGRGPLQGLAAGLAAVSDQADRAYVSSTDVPLLHPAFVRAVVRAAREEDVDVALPVVHGFRHPLAAAYSTSLVSAVEELIAEDRMRPAFLFERSRVRELSEEDLLRDRELAAADPELLSVLNVNEPDEYERARSRAAPSVTVRRFGTLGTNLGREPIAIRAATLEAAATAAGVVLDRHVVAALNGDQITRHPELPLAGGDEVAFLAADAGG